MILQNFAQPIQKEKHNINAVSSLKKLRCSGHHTKRPVPVTDSERGRKGDHQRKNIVSAAPLILCTAHIIIGLSHKLLTPSSLSTTISTSSTGCIHV